jgi:hypothetical protein
VSLFGDDIDRNLMSEFVTRPVPRPDPFTVETLSRLYEELRKIPRVEVNEWLPKGSAFVADDTAADIPEPLKLGQRILLSEDVAMDAGLIPDTRPPSMPPRRRLRDRVRDRWRRLREDVGFWIAGEDPRDHECPYV